MVVQRSISFLALLGVLVVAGFLLKNRADEADRSQFIAEISEKVLSESIPEREVDPDIFEVKPLETNHDEVESADNVVIDFLTRVLYPHEYGEVAFVDLMARSMITDKVRREMLFVPSKTFEVQGVEHDFTHTGVPTVRQDGGEVYSNFPSDKTLAPFETAVYKTTEPGFYIERRAVTNREYRDFIRSAGRPIPPHWSESGLRTEIKDEPVVNLTLNEAEAYASWAGKRLPTDSEMERAFRRDPGIRLGSPLKEWTSTPAGVDKGEETYRRFGGTPVRATERDYYTGFRLVQDE